MQTSYSITNSKGKTILLNDGYLNITSFGSLGSPNFEYQNFTGYLQDGFNVIGYRLTEKTLSLNIAIDLLDIRRLSTERDNLYKFFSPECNPFTFSITSTNNVTKYIDGLYIQNILSSEYTPNSPVINENVIFNCSKPYWKSNLKTISKVDNTNPQLVFPITFPISFGVSGKIYNFSASNNSSYKVYPIITLTGEYSLAEIQDVNKNIKIYLEVGITTGTKRILTLEPSSLSFVDAFGVSKFNEIGINSNLSNFFTEPYSNININVTLFGIDAFTDAQISYNETYLGF